MLRRLAPTLFRGTTGDTVTIAAVASRNNGVETAAFRYGATVLTTRQVQGHPGCDFRVRAATNTVGAVLIFDPSSPNASYELFEEDDSGILQSLQIVHRPLSGAVVQFQVNGVTAIAKGVAAKAAKKIAKQPAKQAARKAAKKASKKRVKKAARTAIKAVRKTSKKTAKKSGAATARKRTRSSAKKRGTR